MDATRLKQVLDGHTKWLMGDGGTRANLRGANLCGADLCDANLRGANLCGADLCDANLRGADLRGADPRGANLCGADLCDADLRGADLRGADLCDADLCGADLCDADLRGANLCGADLRDANLGVCRADRVRVMHGLYEYQCWAIVDTEGNAWARMGCLWKTLADWERVGIAQSNLREYPNDGSEKSLRRIRAFEYVKREAEIMVEQFKRDRA